MVHLLRTKLSRRAAMASAAALAAAVSLAGCSSSASSPGPSISVGSTPLAQLTSANRAHLGGGLTIKLGAVLPLTGSQTFYGVGPLNAIKLAIAQVAAAGGPRFDLQIKDNKSDDPQAVVEGTKELGQAGVPIAIQSFGAGSLAALPGIQQYKILTLDGIGGADPGGGEGQKYFFGTRGRTDADIDGGVAAYLHAAYPDVKSVAVVDDNFGAASSKQSEETIKSVMTRVGIKIASFDLVAPGTTDFSSIISKYNSLNPDAVYVALAGADPGVFYKQYRASGSQKPVIGYDLNADMIAAAGSVLDGWQFATEYFGPAIAQNPWGQYFLKSYAAAYPNAGVPSSYAADSYEDVILFWQLVQRVLAKGGDPTNSDQLRQALLNDPTFPTVYGNSDSVGTFSIDPTTHTPTSRPLGVYRWTGSQVQVLATFDIGGKNFKLAHN